MHKHHKDMWRLAMKSSFVFFFIFFFISNVFAENIDLAETLYQDGLRYYNENKPQEAFRCFFRAEGMGHKKATYYLGEYYFFQNDYKQAVRYYKIAARHQDTQANLRLAYCYEKGLGVQRDIKEAHKNYLLAAEAGLVEAQYRLGCILMTSFKFSDAIKWFEKAAEAGHSDALFKLGYCYEFAHGVTGNQAKAIELYQSAADKGNIDAQLKIGEHYKSRNPKQAVKYYSMAARNGNRRAYNALYELSRNGYNTNDDKLKDKLLDFFQTQDEQLKEENIKLKNYLYDMLNQLMDFKNDSDFIVYGFATASPYYGWLTKMEKKRDSVINDTDIDSELRDAAISVTDLGYEYVASRGRETEYSIYTKQKLYKLLKNYKWEKMQ